MYTNLDVVYPSPMANILSNILAEQAENSIKLPISNNFHTKKNNLDFSLRDWPEKSKTLLTFQMKLICACRVMANASVYLTARKPTCRKIWTWRAPIWAVWKTQKLQWLLLISSNRTQNSEPTSSGRCFYSKD